MGSKSETHFPKMLEMHSPSFRVFTAAKSLWFGQFGRDQSQDPVEQSSAGVQAMGGPAPPRSGWAAVGPKLLWASASLSVKMEPVPAADPLNCWRVIETRRKLSVSRRYLQCLKQSLEHRRCSLNCYGMDGAIGAQPIFVEWAIK